MRDIGYELKKALRYLKHYGVREFLIRLREKGEPEDISYSDFLRENRLPEKELRRQAAECRRWKSAPWFLCLVPETYAAAAEEQLRRQTYPHWEICAGADWLCQPEKSADAARSSQPEEPADARRNRWLFSLEEGDLLEPSALYFAAEAILFPEKARQSGFHWEKIQTPDLIYTDHDEVTADGIYQNPQMKPDFSPEFLDETCYIRYLFLVSQGLAERAADGFLKHDVRTDGSVCGCSVPEDRAAEYDIRGRFASVCARQAESVFHIPRVLYHHASAMPGQTSPSIERADTLASAERDEKPLISIIIPNKDERDTLEKCLAAIAGSSYDRYEIIIVENNSTGRDIFDFYESLAGRPDLRVVVWKSGSGFNYSAINNFGVSHAKGEYLVFLNNDVEILTADWLERLLSDCERPGAAAAGAKLLYPDGTIQHAGIVVGVGGHARGIASNMLVGLPDAEDGYMRRGSLRQNMSAVTAACMMMKRSVFEAIGGFTERLTVAFNDVDLCLKAGKAGYRIVYDPYVKGCHYESKSRGMEDSEEKVRRFQSEIEYMRTQWEDILKGGDPYYSPNLTEYRPDYSLRARGGRASRKQEDT